MAASSVLACTGDGGGDAGDVPATATVTALDTPPAPGLDADPFTLGVASGDPLPDAVVLWTRLVPAPPDPVPVVWEIATDEGFASLVATGVVAAVAEEGHSLHVDAGGLVPATTYWYRFRTGPYTSRVGRTRTAPAPGGPAGAVRFAVASCQAYQTGYFAAHRDLAVAELDVVFFVGDYIYELEPSVDVRPHGLPPPQTLPEYRRFYELNTQDPDLQAARAAHPWVVTWDDHEVEDNYAALEPGAIGRAADPDAASKFAGKRAAAYRAWWEHTPVRTGPPVDGSLRIHRALDFGDLARFAVIDNRQYRDPLAGSGAGRLPRGAGGGPQVPEAFDEERSMLGAEQEAWLDDVLRSSTARWTVLVQQTVLAEIDRVPDDPGRGFSMDGWDGYVANRRRLLATVAGAPVRNFVSVGGDIHTSAVTDLLADYGDPAAAVVGSEFVTPSINALELLPPDWAVRAPWIHLFDPQRHGYLLVELTPQRLTAEYRYVDDITVPDAPVTVGSRWAVEDGRPGATPLSPS
jgi:alkaline phosphatase D